MTRFTNPLDNIQIASPCAANWDEMFGDDRKRFCGECKLNVFNLSDMTRRQAEDLIINSEGRLCVRFFRRSDGTVLTKNCPVGWAAIKRRVSRVATAAFSMLAGLLGGVFAFNWLQPTPSPYQGGITFVPQAPGRTLPQVGEVPGMSRIDPDGGFEAGEMTMGKPAMRFVPYKYKDKEIKKRR